MSLAKGGTSPNALAPSVELALPMLSSDHVRRGEKEVLCRPNIHQELNAVVQNCLRSMRSTPKQKIISNSVIPKLLNNDTPEDGPLRKFFFAVITAAGKCGWSGVLHELLSKPADESA